MAIKLRTKRPDANLKQIVQALSQYHKTHPKAVIEVYRHNNVSSIFEAPRCDERSTN